MQRLGLAGHKNASYALLAQLGLLALHFVLESATHYADPMPQALTLTAIVIGFAMTALFLVVLLASRGMAGNDHVDGTRAKDAQEMP